MLEIAFSQSAAGTLKCAMGRHKGERMESGAVAVIAADPTEKRRLAREMRARTWQGGEIAGNAHDVACLCLQLDYGDISALEADVHARNGVLQALYGHCPGMAQERLETSQKGLARALQAPQIRLWIGEQDACDLTAAFWLCHLLRGREVQMHTVLLPQMEWRGGEIRMASGAADFDAEQMSRHVERSVEIPAQARRYMAGRWQELQRENAPLRAMINGRVESVPEDFYDRMLLREIPQGEWRMGAVLARALGKMRAVGDDLLYRRICAWIDRGVLETVAPAREGMPYSAVLRRGPAWK